MKSDPSHQQYMDLWSEAYQKLNYKEGLSSFFLRKSHVWLEKSFSKSDYFSDVLEVGAGAGNHINFIRHHFDRYIATDTSLAMANKFQTTDPRFQLESQDAAKLTYADNSFDRLIATHVLEHLERPHSVLREWHRVVRSGGIISLVLPCDPGVAWRIGRSLGSRSKFVKIGIDYDYWMAREHINSINNLVSLIQYYFNDTNESWYPFKISSMDLNLFYMCHIKVNK